MSCGYIKYFARSIPDSHVSIPPWFQPRARIAGAKATCEAKKATHVRPRTFRFAAY